MHSVSTDPAFQRRLDELEGLVVLHAREIEPELRSLVEQAQARNDLAAQGWALVILGASLFYQGRFTEVIAVNDLAVGLARRTGQQRLESRALNSLGVSKQKLGQYAQAFEDYTQSLALSRASKDNVSVVRTLSNLAFMYRVHRRFGEAMLVLAEAQELLLRHRHPRYALSVSVDLAWIHIDAGNYEQALAITHLFLPSAQEQPGLKYALHFHCAQALCYLHLKRLPEALACASRAMEAGERQPESDADAVSLVTMAEVLWALKEFQRAEALLLRALDRARQSGSVLARAEIKAKLARVYASQGCHEQAHSYTRQFFEAQERLREYGDETAGMLS